MTTITIQNELVAEIFSDTIAQIKNNSQGPIGALFWLIGEIGTLARQSKINELIIFYLVLRLYVQVTNQTMSILLEDKFKLMLLKPIQMPDPENPKKYIEADMSIKLRWIGTAYDNLNDFFGDTSEDFYYEKAKDILVPKYVDEETFPFFCHVVTQTYNIVKDELKKMVVNMLESVKAKLDRCHDVEEPTKDLWEHILIMHQQGMKWPTD